MKLVVEMVILAVLLDSQALFDGNVAKFVSAIWKQDMSYSSLKSTLCG